MLAADPLEDLDVRIVESSWYTLEIMLDFLVTYAGAEHIKLTFHPLAPD